MTIVNRPKERDLFSVRSRKRKLDTQNRTSNSASKKKRKTNDDEEITVDDRITHIHLTYENLSEGQIILGCISEIRKYEIMINLPNRMQGFLPITHISSSYKKLLSKISYGEELSEKVYNLDEMYSVGQMIITMVKTLKNFENGHLRVLLSILPEDINSEVRPAALKKGNLIQCAVISTEENGFVIDTGIKNLRAAFLSTEDAPEGNVGVGSVLLCAVKKVIKDDDEVSDITLKLSSKPGRIKKASVFSEDFNVSTIIPGNLIEAVVHYVSSDGLELSTSFCKGFVWRENLIYPTDNLKSYEIGTTVKAKVLYIERVTNILVCTLNSKLCEENVVKDTLQGLKIGDVIKKCKIYKSGKEGAHFSLPNDSHGFCSGNKLQGKPIKGEIATKYPVGSIHTCRIIGFNLIDQLFMVSLKNSTSSGQDDALGGKKIGDKLMVEILELNDNGAVVKFNDITGLVPRFHLTDSNMKNPALKYPIGKSFKARLLKLCDGKNISFTLKSELVNTELPIVTNYDNSNVGISTLGCIVCVYDAGFLVELFGNTKTFVNKKNIPVSMRDNMSSYFKEGMIVKCEITHVDKDNQKMKASMIENVMDNKLPVKSIVNCKVITIKDDRAEVEIDDMNVIAYIPFYHFSDDNELSKAIFQCLKKGDIIKNAVVYAKENENYVLSLKPLIYQYIKYSKDEATLNEGDIFPSVISSVSADKVYVSCLKGSLGTNFSILKENICDIPFKLFNSICEDSEIKSLFLKEIDVGYTIFVKYLSKEEKCLKLAANLCYLKKNKEEHSIQLLLNTLMTEGLVKKAYENANVNKELTNIEIGSQVTGKVLVTHKVGTLVKIDNSELYGIVPSSHYNKNNQPQKNQSLQLCVIHINYKQGCLELSAKSSLKEIFCAVNHEIEVGQNMSCEVLLAKREYIIGRAMNHCKGQLIYLPAKRHTNDFKGRHSFYEIGKIYNIIVKFVHGSLILGNLDKHCSLNEVNLIYEIPELDFEEGIPLLPSKPYILDLNHLTKFLYFKKGQELILKATQFMQKKRKDKKLEDKFSVLKNDDFHQYDDEYIWNHIVIKRKERKKMKSVGSRDKKKNNLKVERPNKCLKVDEIEEEDGDIEIVKNKRKTKKKNVKVDNQKEASERKKKERKVGDNIKEENEVRKKNAKGSKDYETDVRSKRRKIERENENDFSNCQSKPTSLQVSSSGFDWSGKLYNKNDAYENSSSSSSDEDDEMDKNKEQKSVKRLSKFEKTVKAKLEEKKTRKLELERLNLDREPETALDYEEKIEKNPHSSSVWIEYISFHLENAETEKAKGVAARALKVIPATLEEEKLALWNVSLRLEVMYGTPESVQNSFKEAVVTNDELKIFYLMIDIYANANKIKEAKEIIHIMTKKYSQDKEVWKKAGLFYFKTKEFQEARNVLEKSLLSLSKQDQIDVINRFAQFEMKYGDPERGKTIFEKILNNFPKRLDIWNVYSDLLLKNEDIKGARVVLERITGLKLKMNATRTAFKKLLEFEKQHGTPQRVEAVKARIEDYVTSALKESEVQ